MSDYIRYDDCELCHGHGFVTDDRGYNDYTTRQCPACLSLHKAKSKWNALKVWVQMQVEDSKKFDSLRVDEHDMLDEMNALDADEVSS